MCFVCKLKSTQSGGSWQRKISFISPLPVLFVNRLRVNGSRVVVEARKRPMEVKARSTLPWLSQASESIRCCYFLKKKNVLWPAPFDRLDFSFFQHTRCTFFTTLFRKVLGTHKKWNMLYHLFFFITSSLQRPPGYPGAPFIAANEYLGMVSEAPEHDYWMAVGR